MFGINSRYYTVERAEYLAPDGTRIVHLRRRFVPSPDRFDVLVEHAVSEGERLDTVAAQYLGDPELFWRLCDANNAIRPEELTETIGRRLRITLPEGIPAPRHA